MAAYEEMLLSKYRSAGVLIDTNSLLLLIVGNYIPAHALDVVNVNDFRRFDFH